MINRISDDDGCAISIAAQCGDDIGPIGPDQIWFALVVRAVWPVKGAMALVQYTGCPERTARHYQRGDREPPAAVLRDLIRGAEGYRVMDCIMRDNPPAWWINLEHHRRLGAEVERIVQTK